MTSGALLLVVAALAPWRHEVRWGAGVVGVAMAFGIPSAIVAGGVVIGVRAFRRARAIGRDHASDTDDELLALDLVSLGVGGGLGFHQAVGVASASVGGRVRAQLDTGLRRWYHRSAGALPASAAGPVRRLFDVATRSASSGAPLQPALRSLAATVRADRAAAERSRLARLPVKLLFPLALLILPGFVLMTVGPTVVSGLSRLAL